VLWTFALNDELRQRMFWDKFGAMRVIGIAAATECPLQSRARVYAYATYSRLAESASIRALMWYNPIIRLLVIEGSELNPTFREESRAAAMATLWQFSFDPQLKKPMWACRRTRLSLISGAANGPTEKVQLYAIYSLRNLAEAVSNQVSMWNTPNLQTALIGAIDCTKTGCAPTLPDAFALSALQVLAYSSINQQSMWKTKDLVDQVLIVAARDCEDEFYDDSTCWHSRQYALAMLLLFSEAKENRKDMFQRLEVTGVLERTCTAPWTENGEGVVGRTYVLETLQFLAIEDTTANALWQDPAYRSTLVDACLVANSLLPKKMPVGQWRRVTLGDDDTETLLPVRFVATQDLPAANRAVVKAGGRMSALGVLTTIAKRPDNQFSMWDEYTSVTRGISSAVDNLVAACSIRDARFNDFRAIGCQGLANLAECATNKKPMWDDAEVRACMVRAGNEHPMYDMDEIQENQWRPDGGVLNDVREAGMRGLANLAACLGVTLAFWLDAGSARQALQLGTRITPTNEQDARTRANACRGFANLAQSEDTREAIWRNEEVRDGIMEAAKDTSCLNTGARKFCMQTLNELSENSQNQPTMWAGAEAVAVARRRRSGISRRLSSSSMTVRLGQVGIAQHNEDGGEAWARLAGFA